MKSDDEEEVKRLREQYLEREKSEKRFNVSIPSKLRFPLAWTVFFIIVGILQQSIIDKKIVFSEFFTTKYLAWFASFGNFASNYQVSSMNDVLMMILSSWYYFFLTGGILSLIWAIISTLTHMQPKIKKEDPFSQI